MPHRFAQVCCIGLCSALVLVTLPATAQEAEAMETVSPAVAEPKKRSAKKPVLDRSGKPQTGKASFYGRKFYGKKMADGTPMDPKSNVAASKTLPFGTKARVTNLENGKSAVVEIRDRGPYVAGRIVDVSPSTAEQLGMKDDGVAKVRVTPIDIPDVKGADKTASAG